MCSCYTPPFQHTLYLLPVQAYFWPIYIYTLHTLHSLSLSSPGLLQVKVWMNSRSSSSANQLSPGQCWRGLDSYPRAPATPSKVPNWLALSRLAQHCDSVSQCNPGLCASCQSCIQCHLLHLIIIYSLSMKIQSLHTKYFYRAAVVVGVSAIHGGGGCVIITGVVVATLSLSSSSGGGGSGCIMGRPGSGGSSHDVIVTAGDGGGEIVIMDGNEKSGET